MIIVRALTRFIWNAEMGGADSRMRSLSASRAVPHKQADPVISLEEQRQRAWRKMASIERTSMAWY